MTQRPEYYEHNFNQEKFYRRWQVARRRTGLWLANFCIPTARVDRDWQDDDLAVWGYTADVVSDGVGVFEPGAVAIFAGDKSVLVRRIDCMISYDNAFGVNGPPGGAVHVSKAFGSYNPVQNNAGEVFPAQIAEQSVALPRARVVVGQQTQLQAVQIGGVLVAPFLGPRFFGVVAPSLSVFTTPRMFTMWDWDDPPYTIKPGEVLFVQGFNPSSQLTERLMFNVWFSERQVV